MAMLKSEQEYHHTKYNALLPNAWMAERDVRDPEKYGSDEAEVWQ